MSDPHKEPRPPAGPAAASGREGRAICPACPHHCALAEGQAGYCRARAAHGGAVVPLGYGRLSALALDPIEKKPLAFFRPGSLILSAGGYGCNMRCPFCQNHEISQHSPDNDTPVLSPDALVARALQLKSRGNIGIAYTYNEPAICWEYLRDTGTLARQAGLVNVMVTNGYFSAAVRRELLPLVDAFNIDLKCFSEEGYHGLGASLGPVLETIEAVAKSGAHLEVTTLVVPGLSDDEADMARQAEWLAALSPDIPLHITRYFPRFKQQSPPTPPETLRRLAAVAEKRLHRVLLGNC